MIRILGAITGSALALATLLLIIGIPQFKTENAATEHAPVTLPRPTTPVDPGSARATAPHEAPGDDAGAGAGDVTASAANAPATPDPVDVGVAGDRLTPAEAANADELPDAVAARPPDMPPALDTPQHWYAFWSPFRSELAANGFVAQLQSVTGLDYRVVRVRPGVYEVAFAYEDDDEITAKLTSITAATGLELPQ